MRVLPVKESFSSRREQTGKLVRNLLLISAILVPGWRPLEARADDWYRWRVPDLNGVSREKEWTTAWPKNGPKQIWKAAVGTGFSSLAVSQGRVYTMGNAGDTDTVFCLNADNGAVIWKHSYSCPVDPNAYEGGPSATPTVDEKVVYTLSKKGHVFCFDAATGKIAWQKNIATELRLEVPDWGFAGSPLVEGNLLILNAGTAGVALDKTSGKVVWSTGSSAAGYSSAVPFDFNQQRFVALFAASEVMAVNARTGKTLWRIPWETSYNVNAADPILHGDKVFVSSGYDRGCAAFRVNSSKPAVLWENTSM